MSAQKCETRMCTGKSVLCIGVFLFMLQPSAKLLPTAKGCYGALSFSLSLSVSLSPSPFSPQHASHKATLHHITPHYTHSRHSSLCRLLTPGCLLRCRAETNFNTHRCISLGNPTPSPITSTPRIKALTLSASDPWAACWDAESKPNDWWSKPIDCSAQAREAWAGSWRACMWWQGRLSNRGDVHAYVSSGKG